MSIRVGPRVGPRSGIRAGVNVGYGTTPQRRFPDSGAAWTSAFSGITTPGDIWTFQESASPILDKVGTNSLVENQALLYAQAGDTEPTLSPRLSLELDTTQATEFTAPATLAFTDIAAASPWSLLVRWRMPDNATTGRAVVNKGAAAPRWALNVQSGGTIRWTIQDGTNTYTPTTVGTYDDGLYHDTLLVYDQAAGLFRVITESESISVASTGFLGVTAAVALHFGAGGGLSALAGTRFSYSAFWPATAITSANLTTFRTPA